MIKFTDRDSDFYHNIGTDQSVSNVLIYRSVGSDRSEDWSGVPMGQTWMDGCMHGCMHMDAWPYDHRGRIS